jgi:hypothetical protein
VDRAPTPSISSKAARSSRRGRARRSRRGQGGGGIPVRAVHLGSTRVRGGRSPRAGRPSRMVGCGWDGSVVLAPMARLEPQTFSERHSGCRFRLMPPWVPSHPLASVAVRELRLTSARKCASRQSGWHVAEPALWSRFGDNCSVARQRARTHRDTGTASGPRRLRRSTKRGRGAHNPGPTMAGRVEEATTSGPDARRSRADERIRRRPAAPWASEPGTVDAALDTAHPSPAGDAADAAELALEPAVDSRAPLGLALRQWARGRGLFG